MRLPTVTCSHQEILLSARRTARDVCFLLAGDCHLNPRWSSAVHRPRYHPIPSLFDVVGSLPNLPSFGIFIPHRSELSLSTTHPSGDIDRWSDGTLVDCQNVIPTSSGPRSQGHMTSSQDRRIEGTRPHLPRSQIPGRRAGPLAGLFLITYRL